MLLPEGGRTFSVVHVRTSDLVHQQHEDEAQHQRDTDAGVELLVAVLMAATGAQDCVNFPLRLGHFHDTPVAVVMVSTCRGQEQNVRTPG